MLNLTVKAMYPEQWTTNCRKNSQINQRNLSQRGSLNTTISDTKDVYSILFQLLLCTYSPHPYTEEN